MKFLVVKSTTVMFATGCCEMTGNCLHCGEEHTWSRNSTGKFCSNQCMSDHKRQSYITEWLKGRVSGGSSYRLSEHVRSHLLESHNHKCSQCGWGETNPHTNKVPLEIDHIDDDPFNHSPDNLQVLCPNCHAVKTKAPSQSKGGRYKDGNHPKYARLAQW